MSLRVLHAATHDHNIGDGALVAGIHATLAEDLRTELAVTPIDVLGCKLRRERDMLPAARWATLADEVQLVIVGGGGMIEGGLGNYLSGINFNFHLDLLERSRVPWVFYALGHNQFRRTTFFHPRQLARLIAIAEHRGFPFSVRNDGSKARLEQLLGPLPWVRVVPDPGMFVPTREHALPELSPSRPNVVVQLSGDRPRARFGGLGKRTLRQLAGKDPIANLARALTTIVERHGAHLVLCPHLMTDLALIAELTGRLSPRTVRESCTLSPVMKGARTAPDFFELYRRADLVIGMRGHSAICAVGLGTPFIGLGTHDKIGGFLDEVGLSDQLIDLDHDPTLAALPRLAGALLADRSAARARFAAPAPAARAAARAFHGTIADLIRR